MGGPKSQSHGTSEFTAKRPKRQTKRGPCSQQQVPRSCLSPPYPWLQRLCLVSVVKFGIGSAAAFQMPVMVSCSILESKDVEVHCGSSLDPVLPGPRLLGRKFETTLHKARVTGPGESRFCVFLGFSRSSHELVCQNSLRDAQFLFNPLPYAHVCVCVCVCLSVCVCNPWDHRESVDFHFVYKQGAPGVLMRPVPTKTLIRHL